MLNDLDFYVGEQDECEDEADPPADWVTAGGERLVIGEMDTKHLFNSMKMLFNHLAEAWGGHPVWFQKRYQDTAWMAREDPKPLAEFVCRAVVAINARGDLPERYHAPYAEIVGQLTAIRGAIGGRAALPEPAGDGRTVHQD